jgi:RNA-directed DNA polymerase
LKAIKQDLRKRLHDSIPEQGQWLRSVLLEHYQYYGVPMNGRALYAFRYHLCRVWKQGLARRSQTGAVSWERMYRLMETWLPMPTICHPFPGERIGVTT